LRISPAKYSLKPNKFQPQLPDSRLFITEKAKAKVIADANNELPPYDNKGKVTPVTGMIPKFMDILTTV
jgi:hypothetical protein